MSGVISDTLVWISFARRRDGMIHAMEGGLWLHRHVWYGRPMAHLVSTDRERLIAWGRRAGLPEERLQYKPLKDPRTAIRRDAWHWDLAGPWLPAGPADANGAAADPPLDSGWPDVARAETR